MADKAVELLDKVVGDKDYEAFVKDAFAAQRLNPATIQKLRTGVNFRLGNKITSDEDRVILRAALDRLNDYMSSLAGAGTVNSAWDLNRKQESEYLKEGSLPRANNNPSNIEGNDMSEHREDRQLKETLETVPTNQPGEKPLLNGEDGSNTVIKPGDDSEAKPEDGQESQTEQPAEQQPAPEGSDNTEAKDKQ